MDRILIECDIDAIGFYDRNENEIIFDCNDNVNKRPNELEEQIKKQSVLIEELMGKQRNDGFELNGNNFDNNGCKVKKWLNEKVMLRIQLTKK